MGEHEKRVRDREAREAVDRNLRAAVSDLPNRRVGHAQMQEARADMLGTISPEVSEEMRAVRSGKPAAREAAFLAATQPIYEMSDVLRNGLGLLAPGLVEYIDDMDARLHDATSGLLGTPQTIDPALQTYFRRERLKRFDPGNMDSWRSPHQIKERNR